MHPFLTMGIWSVSLAGMGDEQRQDICNDLLYGVIQITAIQAGALVITYELGCGGGVVTPQYHYSILCGEAGVSVPAQYRYHQMEIVGGDISIQMAYC